MAGPKIWNLLLVPLGIAFIGLSKGRLFGGILDGYSQWILTSGNHVEITLIYAAYAPKIFKDI